jgi:hypothetical protein
MIARLLDVFLGLLDLKLVHVDWMREQEHKAKRYDAMCAKERRAAQRRVWN